MLKLNYLSMYIIVITKSNYLTWSTLNFEYFKKIVFVNLLVVTLNSIYPFNLILKIYNFIIFIN